VRRVPTPEAEECKVTLRAWMCYEFFNRCNNDGTEFYPVCKTTVGPLYKLNAVDP
jgi:hypothetical protein